MHHFSKGSGFLVCNGNFVKEVRYKEIDGRVVEQPSSRVGHRSTKRCVDSVYKYLVTFCGVP